MKRWFIFLDEQLLLRKDHDIPTTDCFDPHTLENIHAHFIGKPNGGGADDCYCAELPKDFSVPNNMILIPLRESLRIVDSSWLHFVVKGFQILRWDRNHQFCGRCGNKTIDKTTPTAFERHCTHCSMIFYPRISPSVIVLIRKGKQILMARSPHFKPGIYGLIAGFIEPGETAEETVHREVMEEVGIQIKNLRYFGSQPWPFPDALILAFTADYAGGELKIDRTEIEDAGWYDPDKLPGLPSSPISIARKLIDLYRGTINPRDLNSPEIH